MYTSTLIKKAARLLEKRANQLLKPYNIMHGFTYFLLELYNKDGQTQSELQKSIGIEQPTVVRTLDRMERDGFIVRKHNTSDRRVFNIYLTEKAINCKKEVLQSAEILNTSLLSKLSMPEKDKIDSLLEQMVTNLENDLSYEKD